MKPSGVLPFVEWIHPERPPVRVPLNLSGITVGRGDDNDIQISSKYVSTAHCRIELCARVVDLGSMNGTWIDERRVDQSAFDEKELCHFGWDEPSKLRLCLEPANHLTSRESATELSAADFTEAGSEQSEEALLEENRQYQQEIEHLQQTAKSAEQALQGAEQERLKFEKQVQDNQEQVALLQQELQSLRMQVESRAADGEPESVDTQTVPKVVTPSATTDNSAKHFVDHFEQSCQLDLPSTVFQTMASRPGVLADAGLVCGQLLAFSREVEKIVSTMSMNMRGCWEIEDGAPTVLPVDNPTSIRRTVTHLLREGDDRTRQELDQHLCYLRNWFVACISAPKQAFAKWYQAHYDRLSPHTIEAATSVGRFAKAMDWQYREFWKAYRVLREDLAPEIAIDEIDQLTAADAKNIVDRESGNSTNKTG